MPAAQQKFIQGAKPAGPPPMTAALYGTPAAVCAVGGSSNAGSPPFCITAACRQGISIGVSIRPRIQAFWQKRSGQTRPQVCGSGLRAAMAAAAAAKSPVLAAAIKSCGDTPSGQAFRTFGTAAEAAVELAGQFCGRIRAFVFGVSGIISVHGSSCSHYRGVRTGKAQAASAAVPGFQEGNSDIFMDGFRYFTVKL